MGDMSELGQLLRDLAVLTGGRGGKVARPKERERHVIVRAYSGVFFGLLVARRGTEVDLTGVRHIYSWGSSGLPRRVLTVEDMAEIGVGKDSKVSGLASAVTVLDVKLIVDASEAARKCIEAHPCP